MSVLIHVAPRCAWLEEKILKQYLSVVFTSVRCSWHIIQMNFPDVLTCDEEDMTQLSCYLAQTVSVKRTRPYYILAILSRRISCCQTDVDGHDE